MCCSSPLLLLTLSRLLKFLLLLLTLLCAQPAWYVLLLTFREICPNLDPDTSFLRELFSQRLYHSFSLNVLQWPFHLLVVATLCLCLSQPSAQVNYRTYRLPVPHCNAVLGLCYQGILFAAWLALVCVEATHFGEWTRDLTRDTMTPEFRCTTRCAPNSEGGVCLSRFFCPSWSDNFRILFTRAFVSSTRSPTSLSTTALLNGSDAGDAPVTTTLALSAQQQHQKNLSDFLWLFFVVQAVIVLLLGMSLVAEVLLQVMVYRQQRDGNKGFVRYSASRGSGKRHGSNSGAGGGTPKYDEVEMTRLNDDDWNAG